MSTRENFENLFRTCTEGMQKNDAFTTDLYDAMHGLRSRGLIAIKNHKELVDPGLLKELKDIVHVAWGNIIYTVSRHSMQDNDAAVVRARSYITNIATATKAIETILNRRAEQSDRNSLEVLFENCTYNLQKPSAKTPQQAYQIIDKMRIQAWDFLKNEAPGQSRTTLNLIAVLEEFMQEASSAIDALTGENKVHEKKSQATSQVDKAKQSLHHIKNAMQDIRARQTERERQNALGPIESMQPPEAPLRNSSNIRVRREQAAHMSELLMQLRNSA